MVKTVPLSGIVSFKNYKKLSLCIFLLRSYSIPEMQISGLPSPPNKHRIAFKEYKYFIYVPMIKGLYYILMRGNAAAVQYTTTAGPCEN